MNAVDAIIALQVKETLDDHWVAAALRVVKNPHLLGAVLCVTRDHYIVWVADGKDTCICRDISPEVAAGDLGLDVAEDIRRCIEQEGFQPGPLLTERLGGKRAAKPGPVTLTLDLDLVGLGILRDGLKYEADRALALSLGAPKGAARDDLRQRAWKARALFRAVGGKDNELAGQPAQSKTIAELQRELDELNVAFAEFYRQNAGK